MGVLDCNAKNTVRYIPKMNCTEVIKERQDAIHRLLLVMAYILGVR